MTYDISMITEKGVTTSIGLSLPVPSTRVKVHCYVLMENHLHLVATTPEGNLSKWIHQLKTAYTVYFNRRHQVVGHLFSG